MKMELLIDVPAADYIRAMFGHTENGRLVLEDEYGDTEYFLDWDEETAELLAVRCQNLLCDLAQLAKDHDRWMVSTEGMPEDLQKIWNTYILPYPDHGMDPEALFDLSMKAELGDPLTEEEAEMLEQERLWMRENALTRLPNKRCNPANLIQLARRYEKLISLGAPEIVVNNDACCLAEELVLYHCQAR